MVRAYSEWFDDYEQDPAEILQRTFEEVGGYGDIVVLRDIPFEPCCERRLQVQERLTAQIADTIEAVLKPRDVGVIVKGTHGCMSSQGVRKHGVSMVTSRMLGAFRDDPATRQEFLAALA